MKPGFGPKYLEDLAVGDRNQTASIEVTESDSIAFAERYDPQPIPVCFVTQLIFSIQ